MPRSPRAGASPVRAQPPTPALLTGAVLVAALSVVLSACAPGASMADPTGSASATPRPTPTSSVTPTPTVAPTTTAPTTAPADPTTPPDTRTTVDVVIVSWGGQAGEVHASGIVPGVLEDGGICTLTASSAAGDYSATREAQRATDSTDCGVISVPVPAGDWSLSLTYASADAVGQSAPQTATAS